MAARQSVVLWGDFSGEHAPLASIAEEFGFAVQQAASLADLEELQQQNRISAVLIHVGAEGPAWDELLQTVRRALRKSTKMVLCHSAEFADLRPRMVEAGAFYTLLTPLVETETRQALGFIWASKRGRLQEIGAKSASASASRRAGAA